MRQTLVLKSFDELFPVLSDSRTIFFDMDDSRLRNAANAACSREIAEGARINQCASAESHPGRRPGTGACQVDVSPTIRAVTWSRLMKWCHSAAARWITISASS